MNYISRASAALERDGAACTVLMQHIPEPVMEAGTYEELRASLYDYAWTREKSEISRHRGAGEVR